MPSLTLRSLLDLPDVRKWRPEVVAGALALDNPVRWLHVAEVTDIGVMLHGGEAIITTGSLWPDGEAALIDYIGRLRDVGVAGVLLALGRRYRTAPEAAVRACRRRGLPLVVFHRPVPFVEITKMAQELILHEDHAEIAFNQQVADSYLSLTLGDAGLDEVLSHTAHSAGCPVVLENLTNHVLAVAGGDLAPDDLLRDWDRVSRELPARLPGKTDAVTTDAGWTVAPVGARGVIWGRLILCGPTLSPGRARLLGQRAAQALALQRLLHPRSGSWESEGSAALLNDLVSGQAGGHESSAQELTVRARAAGFPLANRVFTPLVLRLGPAPDADPATSPSPGPAPNRRGREELARTVAEAVEGSARTHGLSVLVAVHGPHTVAAVLSSADTLPGLNAVRTLATAVRARLEPVGADLAIGAGHPCTSVHDLPDSFTEAGHVADAALVAQPAGPFARLSDVHVRGLMGMLRHDPRLQGFVERELGPLLEPGAEELLAVLRRYLFSHRNKSATATAEHLSRPALYRRLAEIERRLGVDLTDAERVLSLHVALLALEAQTGRL